MFYKEIGTLQEAKEAKLIPLTVWLFKQELPWLISERKRIGENNKRRAMIVQSGSLYALYVNDVTGRYITDDDYENPQEVNLDERSN